MTDLRASHLVWALMTALDSARATGYGGRVRVELSADTALQMADACHHLVETLFPDIRDEEMFVEEEPCPVKPPRFALPGRRTS